MNALGNAGAAVARALWLARKRRAFRDDGPHRRPRLLVDVSVIIRRDAATGIQRVVRSVWAELAKSERDGFDVVPVYAGARHGYCFAASDFLDERTKSTRAPVGVRPGDKFLGLDLSAHCVRRYAEQLGEWRRHGASLHFVIYDVLPLNRPEWFEDATCRNFRRWIDTVLTHGDHLLCISDSVAQELRRRVIKSAAHRKHRLTVGRLHLSGDIAASLPSFGCSPSDRSTLEQIGSRRTVLMVGTIEPRKAYERALNAFERLWREAGEGAPNLLIIGKRGWKTVALQKRIRSHPEHGRRLLWLENVSDEALTAFYQASTAVLLTSCDEGFGLPAVEAAMHRKWTLVRDLPVFREQGLANLRYFAEDSPDHLAGEVMAMLDLAEREPPAASSVPNWSWCVEQLLAEIGIDESVADMPKPRLRVVS